ncbi:MAG: hypothetical protein ACI9R3_006135 [Verrucomicrobiales bacterium]
MYVEDAAHHDSNFGAGALAHRPVDGDDLATFVASSAAGSSMQSLAVEDASLLLGRQLRQSLGQFLRVVFILVRITHLSARLLS